MSEQTSNTDLAGVCRRLETAESVLVCSHAKPDGDAVGAVLAMTEALEMMGKAVTGCLIPPVPAPLAGLAGTDRLRQDVGSADAPPLPETDLVLVLDTAAWSQLEAIRPHLEPRLGKALVVDHHLSGDVAAQQRYVDAAAAASCEIVGEILDELGVLEACDASSMIPSALFVGLASDTGWFRYSNTRPATHEWAARLLRFGVDHDALYQKLEQTERPEKLALLARALGSMRLLADGRLVIMVLKPEDFAETGAVPEETERLIDVPQVLFGVSVVAMVNQPRPGDLVRASFRSKGGPGAVNVSEVAGELGGGGHARAAGAKLDEPLDQAVERVAATALRSLETAAGSG